MYVLLNEVGYIMDIDDRGYVCSSPKLLKAIKYLSYETALEDSVKTNCKIKPLKECSQVFNKRED